MVIEMIMAVRQGMTTFFLS